jgi:hypothetical protein
MRQFRASLASTVKALGLGFAVAYALSGSNAQAFGGLFDGGGRVGDYLDFVGSANASGARVEIGGVCASACTMKLGARGACVYADAQLWFHAARNEDGRVNLLANLMMLQEYPYRVRAWARARGALNTTEFTTMSGVEAIALGVPSCDQSNLLQAAYSPRPAPQSAPVNACFGGPSSVGLFFAAQRMCPRPLPETTAASVHASFAPQALQSPMTMAVSSRQRSPSLW